MSDYNNSTVINLLEKYKELLVISNSIVSFNINNTQVQMLIITHKNDISRIIGKLEMIKEQNNIIVPVPVLAVHVPFVHVEQIIKPIKPIESTKSIESKKHTETEPTKPTEPTEPELVKPAKPISTRPKNIGVVTTSRNKIKDIYFTDKYTLSWVITKPFKYQNKKVNKNVNITALTGLKMCHSLVSENIFELSINKNIFYFCVDFRIFYYNAKKNSIELYNGEIINEKKFTKKWISGFSTESTNESIKKFNQGYLNFNPDEVIEYDSSYDDEYLRKRSEDDFVIY